MDGWMIERMIGQRKEMGELMEGERTLQFPFIVVMMDD